jgi:hypothetical protein
VLLLVVGAAFGFALTPTAAAKFCVIVDAPPRAHVGQLITVRVMTLADGAWVDGRLVQKRPGLPLPDIVAVTVVDPPGHARALMLERSSRPDMQRGRLALDRRGTWEIKFRKGRYGSCVATQLVRVV